MKNMRNQKIAGIMAALFMLLSGIAGASAQTSLPAPGAGGSFNPAPIRNPGGPSVPGPGMMGNPGPPPNPAWGSPWGNAWSASPTIAINSPSWQNQGVANVMACGYDNRGNWQTIPLRVGYVYNGVQYDVTVLAAYNPWTNTWNTGLSQPAYNTYYYINSNYYDFYTVLTTGTYYFNL